MIRQNKYTKGTKVIVTNHTSLLDAIVASYCAPGFAVMKHSFANFWALRYYIRMARCILIKREGDDMIKTVGNMIASKGTQAMKEQLQTSIGHIGICPEGTVAATGNMMRFKTSAFTLGYPVYPMTMI